MRKIKIKIGIIDDNQPTIENLTEYFNDNYNNLILRTFIDPRVAYREIVKEMDYDILIVDNVMPHIEGLELINRIIKIYRPYIMLITTTSKLKLVKESNLYDFLISKPYLLENVKNALNYLIEKVEDDKKNIIEKDTDKLLSSINNYTEKEKQKNFLKNAITTLLYDEELKQGKIYKQLSQSQDINREVSTIRKHLRKVVEQITKDKLKNILGFTEKPKNIDFMNSLVGKVEDDIKEHKKKKAINK